MKLILIVICFMSLFFYGFVLNLYFLQDDFFHLKISQTNGTPREFINLFSFRSFDARGEIYFYRPIFREGLFNIFYRNFNLSPFPFRLTQLLIHLVNIVLVFKLIFQITKKKNVSLVASLVFGISAANVGVLSYLAGGIQASGMTMFLLLSMIYFLKSKFIALLFFILGLASHELAVAYPAVLFSLTFLKHKLSKKFITQFFWNITPYLIIVVIYIFLQIKIIGLPLSQEEYGLSFSFSRIINSYFWYFIWSMGIPEMLLDFVGPGMKLNPNLMIYWGSYFKAIFSLFGIVLVSLALGLKNLVRNKLIWFFIFWFVVGISPVAFLPLHRSTYYLAPVLPAVGGLFGLALNEIYKRKKILAYLFISAFVVLSLITINLSQTTFWAITRAKIAKNLIEEVKGVYPNLPKGAIIYFTNDPSYPVISKDWGGSSKQARVALSGSNALQLVYKDSSLRVYYEDSDPRPQNSFFPIVAKIRN